MANNNSSMNAIRLGASHCSLTPNITLTLPLADDTLSTLAEQIKLMREQSNQELSKWVETERDIRQTEINRGQIEMGKGDMGQIKGDRGQIKGDRGQIKGDIRQTETEMDKGQTDRKRGVSEGDLSEGEETDNLDADIDSILSAHIGNQAEEASKAKKIKN